MRSVSLGPHLCGQAVGEVSQMRGGVIFPNEPVKSHAHEDWHLTVILSGVALVIGEAGSYRVAAGDAVEVLAHEKHEIHAVGGPVEYRCIGNKGF